MAALLSRCIRPALAFSSGPRLSQPLKRSAPRLLTCIRLQPALGNPWCGYCTSTVTEPSGNYRYSESHEWASLDGSIATVGISNYAQDKLGDAVFVDAPDVGDQIIAGEPFGAVESVKAAADLNSPLSGSVTEINTELQEEPGLVNSEPYERGWIIKIEVSDKSEYDKLMTPDQYKEFLKDSL